MVGWMGPRLNSGERARPRRVESRSEHGAGVARWAAAASVVSLTAGCQQELPLGAGDALAAELSSGTALAAVVPAERADPSALWQRALGSLESSTSSSGVASDASGNVFITGSTSSALPGAEHAGGSDAYAAAYSSAGDALWTVQLGTPQADAAAGIDNGPDGDIFITGNTAGDLAGAQRGFGDAFVARYAFDGSALWARQLGTSQPDAATGVAATAGGEVFVVGHTRGSLEGEREGADFDAFVVKYSAVGEQLWLRQLGSEVGYDDVAVGASADAEGAVFVAGRTFGGLDGDGQGSADAFVAKYSAAGERLWLRQLGGEDYDAAEGVYADASGSVYVVGQTGGFLAGGPGSVIAGHPFVAKYGPEGELLWEQQLEAASMGAATGVASDELGLVFITGYTSAAFGGPNLGFYDAFLAEYSETGEALGAVQLGVADTDRASGVSADAEGRVFISQHATRVEGGRADYTFLTRLR
jgi:hypothetical protein